MRIILLLIALLGLQSLAFCGKADNRFEDAKKAHLEKRFDVAVELLERELKDYPDNPSVYFNLGLAYKANKQYPEAIWAFEKTLKYQPKDSEAIQLIESSYAEMESDQVWQDDTGTFQRALIALGSNFWSILAVTLSVLGALGIILAKKTSNNNRRKWFIGMIVFSVITLFVCIGNASSSYNYEHNHNYAIALKDIEVSLNKTSSEKTAVKFFAGRKLKVVKWHKDGSATVQVMDNNVLIKEGLAKI